jgi:hypothetical protein
MRAIRGKLAGYRRHEKSWWIKSKQFDQKYLNGKVSRLKRLIYAKKHIRNQTSKHE